jgi:hypothetical protein
MNLYVAVPLVDRATELSKWISVQSIPDASQKFTWPPVNGLAPTCTVAASVTTVPGVTDVTGAPPELIPRVVVVAAGTPHNEMVPDVLAL